MLFGGIRNEAYVKIEEYIGLEQHTKELEERMTQRKLWLLLCMSGAIQYRE